MVAVSNQPWYVGQTAEAWLFPLQTDATVTGTSSTTVAAGSVTITTSAGFIATITTATPIVVDPGNGQQETVTPSAVNLGANQFTATFAKSHSGTYTLVANPEDLTGNSINTASFWLTMRSTTGIDTTGLGSFTVNATSPASVFYQPNVADVAVAWSGYFYVKALKTDGREVVWDPLGGTGNTLQNPVPFVISPS